MEALKLEESPSIFRAGCRAILTGKPGKAIPCFIASAEELGGLYHQFEFNLALARGRWQRSRVGQPPSVGVCGPHLEPVLKLLSSDKPSKQDRAKFVRAALTFVVENPYDLIHFSRAGAASEILTGLYQLVWGARVIKDDSKAARPSRVSANTDMPSWSGKLEPLLLGEWP
ncbi:hypothetical protein [Marinimicrobium alkaliphilum]|uniref:hypothetical protein n=1 Tax=Marinimicrobium alkaliphilum TaxID=2202654 RepID=UPI000DB942D8|nr:hypothetical protein [Marinimicrobium alkaliphilum]